MNASIPIEDLSHPAKAWGDEPTSRAPGWVYTDADIYRR